MRPSMILLLLLASALFGGVEEGKEVYAKNCANCHSVAMTGGLGKDLNLVSYERRAEDIANYIRSPSTMYRRFGYLANAMPQLQLDEMEIEAVIDYIDSLQPFKAWMRKEKL